MRLNGRWAQNLSPAQLGIRIDLPGGPGVYKIYLSCAGTAASVTPNVEVRDGSDTAAILLTPNPAFATLTNTEYMDAAGNITGLSAWQGASIYGGAAVEVTVTGSALWVGRTATSGAPILNCIHIFKKAV